MVVGTHPQDLGRFSAQGRAQAGHNAAKLGIRARCGLPRLAVDGSFSADLAVNGRGHIFGDIGHLDVGQKCNPRAGSRAGVTGFHRDRS